LLMDMIFNATISNFLQNLDYCINIAKVLFWPVAVYMFIFGIDFFIDYSNNRMGQPK
jgi:hypothetical protein